MKRYFDLSKETPLGQALRLPTDDETLPNFYYGGRAVFLNETNRNPHGNMKSKAGTHVLGNYNVTRRTVADAQTFETHATLIGDDHALDIGEIYLIEQDAIDSFVDLKGLPEATSMGMIGRPMRDVVHFTGPFAYLNDQIIDTVFPEDDEIMRFWVTRIPWKHEGKGKG